MDEQMISTQTATEPIVSETSAAQQDVSEAAVSEQTAAENAVSEKAASERKTLLKKPLDPRFLYYSRIIGTLFAITAVVAVVLGAVNLLTKPIIHRQAEEKRLAALAEVLPDAQYEAISALPSGVDGLVSMACATRDGAAKGYCVQVKTNGFGGEMELMVGVDETGAVSGVSFLSMSETPGVGSKAKSESWFIQQFLGRRGEIALSKTQADSAHIQAISGATTTSTAVTKGINTALQAVSAYKKGGVS